MTTKPMRPLPGASNQGATVQVDLRDAETLKCEHCGNYLFILCYVLKRLSALVSPTGKEEMIPVQVYSCGDCGKVSKLYTGVLGDEVEANVLKEDKPDKEPLFRADL
jgi:hypothetical protein